MLSQLDQKKIILKIRNIYKPYLSDIKISNCSQEITKIINKFNKKK